MSEGLAENPKSILLRTEEAAHMLETGNHKGADDVLAKLMKEHPGNLMILKRFAAVKLASNKPLPVLEKLSPYANQKDWEILYLLGRGELVGGNASKALVYLKQSLGLNPEWPSTYLYASKAFERNGDITKAKSYERRYHNLKNANQ